MDMKTMVRENPLLAIMRNVPLEKTVHYAQAAFDGGVKFFEVAMNSPHGAEQITRLAKHFSGKALIGAGTAITVERARKALEAGAMFLLTPSCPVDVLKLCEKERIRFLPGVLTPTDVDVCLQHGFSTLKMFPAGDMPMGYVKSLQGPFDGTEYVAIGGVTPDNAADFIKAGYLGVGLGSNLFPKEYVAENAWDKATECVRDMAARVKRAIG
jgi:Entner-Doudoroff aldolase